MKAKAHKLANCFGPEKPEVRVFPNPWRSDCYLSADDWMLVAGPWLKEEGRPCPTVLKFKPPVHDMPLSCAPPPSPAPPPEPTSRRPKQVKRPEPSYQGCVDPKPRYERREHRNGPGRKSTRREEKVKRAEKTIEAYWRRNPRQPLYIITEPPPSDIQNTNEQEYDPVTPLAEEELAREPAEKQAEEEELAAIRAEMRANRF